MGGVAPGEKETLTSAEVLRVHFHITTATLIVRHVSIFFISSSGSFTSKNYVKSTDEMSNRLNFLVLQIVHNTKFVVKGKGKGRLWVLQHCCLEVYCTITRMSSFIHLQRRCTHQAA